MPDDEARARREVAELVIDELRGRDWRLESACLSTAEVASRLGIGEGAAAKAIRTLAARGLLRCFTSLPTGESGDGRRLLALAPTESLMSELYLTDM